jgi:hypothetical protein
LSLNSSPTRQTSGESVYVSEGSFGINKPNRGESVLGLLGAEFHTAIFKPCHGA